MKRYNKIILSIIFCIVAIIISCNDIKKKSINKKASVVSNSNLLKGWKHFDKDTLRVNLPIKWNPKPIKDALLYIPLDRDKANLYYVVLNYNTAKIDYNNYVKEIFKQVFKNDNKFTYRLKKVTFKNNNDCYIMQIFTNENNIKYKIYSLIYKVGNQIYDFSYKTLDDKNENSKNYQTFYSVIFSFEYKYDNIIDSEKFIIENEKIINYNNL